MMKKTNEKRIPQITIGPDYFRTTVRKESIYPLAWRWTKETLQNSYDAGASRFVLNLYENERAIEVVDNGSGMTEDVLLDVFLSIGGSKKDVVDECAKPIGGFGDAKKIVCFCWDRWEIASTDNYLNNEMIGVGIDKVDPIVGTRIKVWMGSEFDPQQVVDYINLCQLDIVIEVNLIKEVNDKIIVETIPTEKLRKNKLINDLEFAKLYVNKSKPSELLIVRLNGLALYTESIDGIKATCVLELESVADPKSNEYILNVTREQLNWKYRSIVHSLIMEMLSNPVKSLKKKKEERVVIYTGVGACASVTNNSSYEKVTLTIKVDDYINRFRSETNFDLLEKHRGEVFDIVNVYSNKEAEIKDFLEGMNFEELIELIESRKNDTKSKRFVDALKCPILIEVVAVSEGKNPLQEIFPYDIIVKGTTKKRYDGIKYQRLLLAWHKMIQFVCYYNTLNGNEIDLGDYKIGFIFDDDVLAQRCVIEGVPCYLLNPSDLTSVLYTWRGLILELLNRATHEIAHNFEHDHNGNFNATLSNIQSWMYMYIEEVFHGVGLIIKSTQKNLVSNAMFNQKFDYF